MSTSAAATAAPTRLKAWVQATSALLRAELRGLAPIVLGLLACALAVLYLARRFWGANLPIEGDSHAILCRAVALAALIPMTAELIESDWRRGTVRVYQAAPLRRHQLFVAKTVAATLLGLLLFIALRLLDPLVIGTLMAAPPSNQAAPLDTFQWHKFGGTAWVLAWLGVTATGIAASIFRHSLAATLLGLLLVIGPALLSGATGVAALGGWFLPRGSNVLPMVAFGIALGSVPTMCLAATYRLRGKSSRSLPRRMALGGVTCMAIAITPPASLLAYRLTGSDPTFDHPDAYVSGSCDVSPDGRFGLLRLAQRGHTNRFGEVSWLVDAQTLEVRLVPDAFRVLHPILFFGWYEHGAFWSYDGTKIVVNGQSGWDSGYGESVLLDPLDGSVEELPISEFGRIGEYAGWSIKASHDPDDEFVGYHCAGPRGEKFDLEAASRPKVPRDANHLLFYESSEREVRVLDTRTEADRAVVSLTSGESLVTTSATGEWLLLRGPASRMMLVEVATGERPHSTGGFRGWKHNFDYPLLQRRGVEGYWSLVSLRGSTFLRPVKTTTWLERFPGDRFIGGDTDGGVWVFGADGSLVKELRPSRHQGGAQ